MKYQISFSFIFKKHLFVFNMASYFYFYAYFSVPCRPTFFLNSSMHFLAFYVKHQAVDSILWGARGGVLGFRPPVFEF